ncbi:TBC1 domain protein [Histomonas meleagridis]|uniref:TBC1 domain protein n=1 Tax=Histomonas meleagridis TaxID=135588 RepID=UPI0035599A8C|nr:TBC1 domain protein [Histomonas meleagridis]KAH0799890.1 TBC1 domain protein [Histomonas meleagridis]
MTSIRNYIENSTPENPINVELIRQLARRSLEVDVDRAYSWLVLFQIFPSCFIEWPLKLSTMSDEYWGFVNDFGVKDWDKQILPSKFQQEDFKVPHPETMLMIHSDVTRTGHQLFFLPDGRIPGSQLQESSPGEDKLFYIQGHIRRIERILYIFAMLNHGLNYIQGFNELVSPFYILLTKTKQLWNNDFYFVEGLCFHMFQRLISTTSINDFCSIQDKTIVIHQLAPFLSLQKKYVPVAADIISTLKIHPLFYCVRWFSLLFSQEYELPNLFALWDCLFSHFDHLMDYVFFVGLGHLKYVEPRMSPTDYAKTITALKEMDVGDNLAEVIGYANAFWNTEHKTKQNSVSTFIKNMLPW